MAQPSVFIGVVSYQATRFPHSQGDEGLGMRLRDALEVRQIDAHVEVDTSDRWTSAENPIGRHEMQSALSAQVRLEDEWVDYVLCPQRRNPRQVLESIARWALRAYRRLRPPSTATLARLINIELSHTALLAAGIESGSPWIIILEDDAETLNTQDLADGLAGLMNNCPDSVNFINLSESFNLDQLGIAGLFEQSHCIWEGSQPRLVKVPSRPVTNTVCAIAYRRGFARRILEEFAQVPLHPVVPIDWKVNQTLMRMFAEGELGAESCAWVLPGPIDQMSMR